MLKSWEWWKQLWRREWQPIATAPKDGTRLLLGYRKGWVGGGWWDLKQHCWVLDRGGIAADPTHWALMPKAPE